MSSLRWLSRSLQLVGLALAVAGLTLVVYFSLFFDTWALADASAPPGIDVPGDPREQVPYPSEELAERARDGTEAGVKVLLAGVAAAVAGTVGSRVGAGRDDR